MFIINTRVDDQSVAQTDSGLRFPFLREVALHYIRLTTVEAHAPQIQDHSTNGITKLSHWLHNNWTPLNYSIGAFNDQVK